MTYDELLAGARRRLAAAPFQPSRREAALLLGHVSGLSEAQVLARGPEPVAAAAAARFEALLARRLVGEPVAYLFGEREFHGRPFWVGPEVLIPRPETEHLVEAALALPLPAAPRVLDLGTGSGCLAITLACELAGARVLATDRSFAALAWARRNRRRHRVDASVRLLQADWLGAFAQGPWDLVISNPPYVDPALAPALSPEVRDFEPATALFAPAAGLAAYRAIAGEAGKLRLGTWLLFEIGDGQLAGVEAIVAASRLEVVEVRADYAGKPRVVVLKRA